jgi:hypothetical protein
METGNLRDLDQPDGQVVTLLKRSTYRAPIDIRVLDDEMAAHTDEVAIEAQLFANVLLGMVRVQHDHRRARRERGSDPIDRRSIRGAPLDQPDARVRESPSLLG